MDLSISAGWLPHYLVSSRGCLALIAEITPRGSAHSKLSRVPLIVSAHRVADLVLGSMMMSVLLTSAGS
jgi:hypothetical protein